jgi:putative SOS response-associated peptidase YedK
MCGRYTLANPDDIAREVDAVVDPAAKADEWFRPRYNIAPTQRAAVVTLHDEGRVVEMMRWGLLPFWSARDGASPPLMINARVESIRTKPVFRDALARKRCLVPADGFYEWRHAGKKGASETMYLHPGGGGLAVFAGLWARVKTDDGELRSFTIVTTAANPLVSPIHDRMPVVLARDAWAAWLDPGLDADGADALLGAPEVAAAGWHGWRVDQVSSWVNSVAHDDPRCLEPEPQLRLL